MYLKRRLQRLEEKAGEVDEDQHIISEAVSRATDEDLELICEYLNRTEEEEEPTPEEWAAIERHFQLREEVRREL